MDEEIIKGLNKKTRDEIIAELLVELNIQDDTEDIEYRKLISRLDSAVKAIKRVINFPERYNEKMEADYLDDYFDNIKDLTTYDYLQDGASGEVTHNENGTSRTWKSRRECFFGIVSFAE